MFNKYRIVPSKYKKGFNVQKRFWFVFWSEVTRLYFFCGEAPIFFRTKAEAQAWINLTESE